jgi:hypothetical protein
MNLKTYSKILEVGFPWILLFYSIVMKTWRLFAMQRTLSEYDVCSHNNKYGTCILVQTMEKWVYAALSHASAVRIPLVTFANYRHRTFRECRRGLWLIEFDYSHCNRWSSQKCFHLLHVDLLEIDVLNGAFLESGRRHWQPRGRPKQDNLTVLGDGDMFGTNRKRGHVVV